MTTASSSRRCSRYSRRSTCYTRWRWSRHGHTVAFCPRLLGPAGMAGTGRRDWTAAGLGEQLQRLIPLLKVALAVKVSSCSSCA